MRSTGPEGRLLSFCRWSTARQPQSTSLDEPLRLPGRLSDTGLSMAVAVVSSPILAWDERFSSVQVVGLQVEGQASRRDNCTSCGTDTYLRAQHAPAQYVPNKTGATGCPTTALQRALSAFARATRWPCYVCASFAVAKPMARGRRARVHTAPRHALFCRREEPRQAAWRASCAPRTLLLLTRWPRQSHPRPTRTNRSRHRPLRPQLQTRSAACVLHGTQI